MLGPQASVSDRDRASHPAARWPTAPSLPTLAQLLQPKLELPATDGYENAGDTPEWLHASGWRIYATAKRQCRSAHAELLESFALASGDRLDAVRLSDGRVIAPFDFDEAYQNFLSERWRAQTDLRGLGASRLTFYYRVKRLLPRGLQLALRRLFIASSKTPAFPGWPLELSVDRLTRFYARCLLANAEVEQAPFTWFWPGTHHAALILTHDVETGDGLRLALELADLEQERGFRSSFNVVAGDYPVDDGILRELADRGFEIGLHGLHHDRSLFSSRAEFERQLPALVEAAERFGSHGFRSPATHRVLEWLPELPALYDCTVPHADRYEPQPGGCCSLWPYSIGRIVELPWTLPQDHILFTLLRQRSAAVWLQQVQEIESRFRSDPVPFASRSRLSGRRRQARPLSRAARCTRRTTGTLARPPERGRRLVAPTRGRRRGRGADPGGNDEGRHWTRPRLVRATALVVRLVGNAQVVCDAGHRATSIELDTFSATERPWNSERSTDKRL